MQVFLLAEAYILVRAPKKARTQTLRLGLGPLHLNEHKSYPVFAVTGGLKLAQITFSQYISLIFPNDTLKTAH